jgi:hypothetical protein
MNDSPWLLGDAVRFSVNDRVAWALHDGRTMAGTVTGRGHDKLYVTRVDGGACAVAARECRPAGDGDVLAACRVFTDGPFGPAPAR